MRIAVGSQSTYKYEAVVDACSLFWCDGMDIVAVGVDSNVPAQPMSDRESIAGARNRALGALAECGASIGVGIENGLTQVEGMWFATTWVVVIDDHGREGIASTLLRPVPGAVMDLVHNGDELSDAVQDAIPHHLRSNRSGLIGAITGGRIGRHEVLRDGIVVALSMLLQRDIY